jgi:hypothetical protein
MCGLIAGMQGFIACGLLANGKFATNPEALISVVLCAAVGLWFFAVGFLGRNEGSFEDGAHQLHRLLGPLTRWPAERHEIGALRGIETRRVPEHPLVSDLVLMGTEGEHVFMRGSIAQSWAMGVLISTKWGIPLAQGEDVEIRVRQVGPDTE